MDILLNFISIVNIVLNVHKVKFIPKIPELMIVFVNYHAVKVLEECLCSLSHQTYTDFEVKIVDHAPGMKEFTQIQEISKKYLDTFPITLLKPHHDLYFAGGNNFAIRHSKNSFFLLLNSDTELEPDSLAKIMTYMKQHPRVGMLCPKLLNFYDKRRFWYAGAYVNPRDPKFTYHFGINQIDRGQFDKITTTAYACGCALFVSRAAIEKAGLMDEIFFCYTEECDWNYTVREKGFQIVYFPKTTIYHKVPLTSDRRFLRDRKSPFESYLYARNQIIFMLKHFSIADFFSFFFLHAIRKPITEFLYAIIKRRPIFFVAQIRALIMGSYIGLKRRFHRNSPYIMRKEWHYLDRMDSTTNSQNANKIK